MVIGLTGLLVKQGNLVNRITGNQTKTRFFYIGMIVRLVSGLVVQVCFWPGDGLVLWL